jgi:hypothetical protein
MVGKSLNERPVAPGPPLKRVSPEKRTPSVRHREAAGPGRVTRRVQHPHLDVADLQIVAVGQVVVGRGG